jgi:hypothetical protein
MLQCHATGKFHFAFQCVGDSLRMKEWMCVEWSRTRFFLWLDGVSSLELNLE